MSDNEQMNENRNTIADIVAMVRRAAQYYEGEAEKSEGLLRESFELSAVNYRMIANLVEAAWKRERAKVEADALSVGGIVEAARTSEKSSEVGNAAEQRKALEEILLICYKAGARYGYDVACGLIKAKAKNALAAPPRQCDAGTADEQAERHKAYCRKHFTPDQIGENCRKCPLKDRRLWSCQLAWAQMPYEAEGESDEQK